MAEHSHAYNQSILEKIYNILKLAVEMKDGSDGKYLKSVLISS